VALTNYETLVYALLQAPSSPIALIPTATIDSYINIARNQVAADGECIRTTATLAMTAGVRSYAFSAMTPIGTGIGSVIAIRSAQLGGGGVVYIINWERFAAYYQPDASQGVVTLIAQQGQGVNGTISTYHVPNGSINLSLDVTCLPIALANDSTPEAIPELWTDAVPFYAAWLGFQQLQRQADAGLMMDRYKELMKRGRELATPSELPDLLPGGVGAQIAASHSPLSQSPQASR